MIVLLVALSFAQDSAQDEIDALREVISAMVEESDHLRAESDQLKLVISGRESQISILRTNIALKDDHIESVNRQLAAEIQYSKSLERRKQPEWLKVVTAVAGGVALGYIINDAIGTSR